MLLPKPSSCLSLSLAVLLQKPSSCLSLWQCCYRSQVPVSLSLSLWLLSTEAQVPVSLPPSLPHLPLAVLLQKPSSCLSLSLSLSLCLSVSLWQCCFRSQVPVSQRPAPRRTPRDPHHHPEPAQPRDHRGYGGEGLQKISPNIVTGAKRAITALKNNSPEFCYVIAPGLLQDFPVEPPKIIRK